MLLRDGTADQPLQKEPSDFWLVSMLERARAKEQTAFAILFEHYKAKICPYLTRIIRDDGIAHDLAQETFFKAWQALPTLHDPACFRLWLYCIATREAFAHLRRTQPTDRLSWVEEEDYDVPRNLMGDGPEKQVGEAELIKWMLAQLPLRHRPCLVLQIEGFTQREIAKLVGISEKHVSVSISRPREQSRQISRRLKGEMP